MITPHTAGEKNERLLAAGRTPLIHQISANMSHDPLTFLPRSADHQEDMRQMRNLSCEPASSGHEGKCDWNPTLNLR